MKKKITLLFPGQGSQYVGMGKRFENMPEFNLFASANEILGFNLSKIIFEGPSDELQLTYNAQPAILTYSLVLNEILKKTINKHNLLVERVLGHSLGEYSALCSAGTLSFSDAVMAVFMRGKFMQDAVAPGIGSMVAIMKVDKNLIKEACEKATEGESKVMPANFNEPNQTVISGTKEACDRAVEWLKENIEGRLRAIPLKVSAPFHSSLMKPAAEKLEVSFNDYTFNPNTVPYIANIDAQNYEAMTSINSIKNNLVSQVTGSVQWVQSIKKIPAGSLCLEVGPGKVLAGLVKKINPEIKTISLDLENSFTELEDILS